MRTLVINGKKLAFGRASSLLVYAKIIIRKNKIQNPEVTLMEGIVI